MYFNFHYKNKHFLIIYLHLKNMQSILGDYKGNFNPNVQGR